MYLHSLRNLDGVSVDSKIVQDKFKPMKEEAF